MSGGVEGYNTLYTLFYVTKGVNTPDRVDIELYTDFSGNDFLISDFRVAKPGAKTHAIKGSNTHLNLSMQHLEALTNGR